MSQVFISHVEEDASVALEIAKGLEAAGHSTWYYERDSDPGPSYLLQIDDAILNADVVVLIISPQSLGSHQVTNEVVRASESDKAFMPVLLGISHAQFQEQQPEWRLALGAAASIPVPPEGVAGVLPRILKGLRKLQHGGRLQRLTRRVPVPERPVHRALLAVCLLLAIGGGLLWYYPRWQLNHKLNQATEFSDSFLNGTVYWSAPKSWQIEKGRLLRVSGPGIGLIKDRMFRNFTASFDVQFINGKGAVWILRAQDARNYYQFRLLGPQGSPPKALVTSVCRNGTLTPLLTLPVSQDLGQPGDWFHIIVEARGSAIDHKIEVSSQPERGPQKLASLDDRSFLYGTIGFATQDGEEFYSSSVTVVPIADPSPRTAPPVSRADGS